MEMEIKGERKKREHLWAVGEGKEERKWRKRRKKWRSVDGEGGDVGKW